MLFENGDNLFTAQPAPHPEIFLKLFIHQPTGHF